MSNFEKRVQKLQCGEATHDNKPIVMICFNKDCEKRKACLTCIDEFHSAHKGELASIDDVEQFITKNCIKLKGAYQCNEILGKYSEFQKMITKQLQTFEFILKEKVKHIFNEMNGVNENKLQQIGDDQEEELNELNKKCSEQISELKNEWNNRFTQFKKILTPIEIKLQRFDKQSENEILLNDKQSFANVLLAKQTVKLQSIQLTELLNQVVNEKQQRESNYDVEFNLCSKMNLTEKIHTWKVQLNHQSLKNINGSYVIPVPENVYLKEGEQYSLEIKSQEAIKFLVHKESSLSNELIEFQYADFDKGAFKVDDDRQIVSSSQWGIFTSFNVVFE